MKQAIEFLEAWIIAHQNMYKNRMVAAATCSEFRWKKPEIGFVKCNSDIAQSENGTRVGIGILIRDDSGSVIFSSWSTFDV